MTDKKNIILAFGNKEFNDSLTEVKEYLRFNLETTDNLKNSKSIESYEGLIIHEDALKENKYKDIIKNQNLNKLIFP